MVPSSVRYIKLGKGGGWERECIEAGIARLGYGTERASRFSEAREGRWADLAQMFRDEGKDPGTAKRFSNDTRQFFHADGTTLWITFYGQQLWWAFFDPAPPGQHPDGRGTFRRVIGAWASSDVQGGHSQQTGPRERACPRGTVFLRGPTPYHSGVTMSP